MHLFCALLSFSFWCLPKTCLNVLLIGLYHPSCNLYLFYLALINNHFTSSYCIGRALGVLKDAWVTPKLICMARKIISLKYCSIFMSVVKYITICTPCSVVHSTLIIGLCKIPKGMLKIPSRLNCLPILYPHDVLYFLLHLYTLKYTHLLV